MKFSEAMSWRVDDWRPSSSSNSPASSGSPSSHPPKGVEADDAFTAWSPAICIARVYRPWPAAPGRRPRIRACSPGMWSADPGPGTLPRAMPLDPRTPVIVGVGQVTCRPDPEVGLADRMAPVDVMAASLRTAAEDCEGSAPGGTAGPGGVLLARADSLRVVSPLGWRPANPGLLVAERLDIDPPEQVLSAVGGNMPLSLLHASAREIAAGAARRRAGHRGRVPVHPLAGTPRRRQAPLG